MTNDARDFKPRYMLIVRVEGASARTSFTFLSKEVEELIGVHVETLISELPQDAEVVDIPSVVRNIVGKRCAFNIKINAYNTQHGYEEYTVFRLSVLTLGETEAVSNGVGALLQRNSGLRRSANKDIAPRSKNGPFYLCYMFLLIKQLII